MATEWRIKAAHLGNCNCAYGCPCKFTGKRRGKGHGGLFRGALIFVCASFAS
jgi:hypothetical protein